MFGFGTLKLAVVAVIAVSLAVIAVTIRRGCQGPPVPDVDRLGPYAVASVESGASLTVKHGRRERRNEAIALEGIAAPAPEQPLYAESRDGLRQAAGSEITIEVEGRRRDRTQRAVYGASGQCLQQEQLAAGWAWIVGEGPEAWQQAQQAAQVARKGVWAKAKDLGLWTAAEQAYADHQAACEDCGDSSKALCETGFQLLREAMRSRKAKP